MGAQRSGGIRGMIKAMIPIFLPSASIKIGNPRRNQVMKLGRFKIALVPGNYIIEVSYIGFQPVKGI